MDFGSKGSSRALWQEGKIMHGWMDGFCEDCFMVDSTVSVYNMQFGSVRDF